MLEITRRVENRQKMAALTAPIAAGHGLRRQATHSHWIHNRPIIGHKISCDHKNSFPIMLCQTQTGAGGESPDADDRAWGCYGYWGCLGTSIPTGIPHCQAHHCHWGLFYVTTTWLSWSHDYYELITWQSCGDVSVRFVWSSPLTDHFLFVWRRTFIIATNMIIADDTILHDDHNEISSLFVLISVIG